MKIKELFDGAKINIKYDPALFFSYSINTRIVFPRMSLVEIKNRIENEIEQNLNKECKVDVYENSFDIKVKLIDGNCYKLHDEVHAFIQKLVNKDKFDLSLNLIEARYCPTDKPLPFVIKFAKIRLICFPENDSLIGIHKKIDCEKVIINGDHNIKFGGLGLLKIKNLKSIVTTYIPDATTDWWKIIKNHLEDKDILACQEELMDAGLGAHAKL